MTIDEELEALGVAPEAGEPESEPESTDPEIPGVEDEEPAPAPPPPPVKRPAATMKGQAVPQKPAPQKPAALKVAPQAKPAPTKTPPKPAPKAAASPAYEAVGWDSDVQVGGMFMSRYKGQVGRRDRIRLMPWADADGTVRKSPAKVFSHFDEVKKRSVPCSNTDDCPACASLGKDTKRQAFAMPVMWISRTDVRAKTTAIEGKLLCWTFGADKFVQIRDGVAPAAEEMGKSVTGIDIMIACTDSKLQKLSITPLPGPSKMTPEMVAAYKADAAKFLKFLLEDHTEEAVQKSLDRGGPKRRAVADEEFEDEAMGSAGSRPRRAATTVDEELDGLLA